MGSKLDTKKALRKLMETGDEIYSIPCTVDSVDLVEKTCYCIPLDKRGDLQGVRLIADNKKGFLIIPVINSVVLVTMINDTTGYVAMFSEVDEIQLNSDTFGGVMKITETLSEVNTRFATLKTAILAALTSIDASIVSLGGVSASATAFTTATATITNILKTQVENTKVKHGNGL